MFFSLLLAALVSAPLAAQDAPKPKPVDVAGKWIMVLELSIGNSNPTLTLKQDGAKITGTYTGHYGDAPLEGTIDEKGLLQFTVALVAEGESVSMYFRGEVSADGQSISKGGVQVEGLGDGSWAAKRQK
jgi:hypothetical protein